MLSDASIRSAADFLQRLLEEHRGEISEDMMGRRLGRFLEETRQEQLRLWRLGDYGDGWVAVLQFELLSAGDPVELLRQLDTMNEARVWARVARYTIPPPASLGRQDVRFFRAPHRLCPDEVAEEYRARGLLPDPYAVLAALLYDRNFLRDRNVPVRVFWKVGGVSYYYELSACCGGKRTIFETGATGSTICCPKDILLGGVPVSIEP